MLIPVLKKSILDNFKIIHKFV